MATILIGLLSVKIMMVSSFLHISGILEWGMILFGIMDGIVHRVVSGTRKQSRALFIEERLMLKFRQYMSEEYELQGGSQYGSNPGGIHVHKSTGEKHYIKYYKNGDQAKVEALTGKIYKHMGIHTLEPEHKTINGKDAVSTKWNEHLHTMHGRDFEKLNPEQHKQIGKMYHAAILTKNWDIVGLEHDNIMKHSNGNLHAIDHGGSFHFRARGSSKDYGPDIAEHKSLRNADNASGHVFNHVFKKDPEAERHGLEAVKKIDDNHVHKLFKESGLSNHEELHKNFMARKKALIDHYEKKT